MNHGSLGYFNEYGHLSLKQEIIDGLCLGNNSKLYGIYYPCPSSTSKAIYKHVTLKHDFMLTPIPYRFWPVSGKLYIHLVHHLPSLNKICEYFVSKNISIIHAESTRSSYRYATWSLHIAFEDLIEHKDLVYDKKSHYFSITKQKFDDLIRDLNQNDDLQEFLYRP